MSNPFHPYRSLAPFFARQRRALLLGLLTLLLTNLFTFAAPGIMKLAVDGLQSRLSPARLLWYCSLILGAALLQGVFRFWARLLIIGVSREVEYDLRNLVFSRLLAHAPGFFQRYRTGDLMSRATADVESVRMVIGPGIMQLGNTLLTFAFAIGMMLSLDAALTLWSLLPMPAIAAVMYGSAQAYHRRFLAVQVQQAALNTVAQEDFSGIRVVKTYGLEARQRAAFLEANRAYLATNMRLARALGFFHPLVAMIAGLGTLIVLWAGGRRLIEGGITIGTLVAFMALFGLLTWPTIALGWVVSLFQRGAAAMGRIDEILAAPPEIPEPEAPLPCPDASSGGAALEVRRLTFAYPGRAEPALRGVSFSVAPGERVALVGRTGAGKSTLLALLPRLWPVADGTVFFDGADVNRLALGCLRGGIGFVPQETFLFSESVAENIALGAGAGADADARVRAAARVAQFDADVTDFPDGYDTAVGERGVTLSGGQKQRAAIARALAARPRLLVLDDALSSVDTETEERILDALFAAQRERTTLFVSHRLSTMRRADRILVLEAGALVEAGTHEELMERGGAYRRLIERQLLAERLEREEP